MKIRKSQSEKKYKTFQGLVFTIKSFFAHEFFKSNIALWLIVLSIIANLATWILLIFLINPVDFPIILHYNVYFGVDMVGIWQRAYMMPAIGLILLIINLFLAIYFYGQKERIASYILMIAALMIQFSLLIASISVIIINY